MVTEYINMIITFTDHNSDTGTSVTINLYAGKVEWMKRNNRKPKMVNAPTKSVSAPTKE